MGEKYVRITVNLYGTVQGVGLRPTLLRVAVKAGLGGWVQNRSGYVRLQLEGKRSDLGIFLKLLPSRLPPQARLNSVKIVAEQPLLGKTPLHRTFHILHSLRENVPGNAIPPDIGVCGECMGEVSEPADRRYGYPFTTCTNCGPRYTVVHEMPYDRESTTLSIFPLCPECKEEYTNPHNRRFHAESIACPVCGPKLFMLDSSGTPVNGKPLVDARRTLAEGKILAIRGIGGFQLVVNAYDTGAIERLRIRKNRPHKPFAVMARDMEIVRRYCNIPYETERLLSGTVRPIIILDIKEDACIDRLGTTLLTPDNSTIGVMLPTSPLHKLLFEPLEGDTTPPFDLLVMTSGNRGGEPIYTKNEDAYTKLGGVADLFLCHNREITLRSDDSVCIIQGNTPQVIRRARGYAPTPIRLPNSLTHCVLSLGADFKNTIAVGSGSEVVLSPHIGDIDSPESIHALEQVVRSLPVFLQWQPEIVAVDLHPDMNSSGVGRKIADSRELEVVAVQHHHAHAMACLAEHGIEEGLALVFDGTGIGTDGTIWGAEMLHVNPNGFTRFATFAESRLPGGEAAVLEPVRQLVARFVDSGVEISSEWQNKLDITETEVDVWTKQIQRGLNTPVSHSAGRLFDAFAALLGLAPRKVTYEGQAAIRLEAAAWRHSDNGLTPKLPFREMEKDGLLIIDWADSFRMLSEKLLQEDEPEWAMAVHSAVSRAAAKMAIYGRERSSLSKVALSGGVFQNRILTRLVKLSLLEQGFEVLIHRKVPPNDGGLSLGQAVIAGRGQVNRNMS